MLNFSIPFLKSSSKTESQPAMGSQGRPVRIAGASGGFSDRQRAISSLAKLDVDVIVGDWLSECTMTLHGAQKVDNEQLRAQGKLLEEPVGLFDPTFLDNLGPALEDISRKGIKVAVNAGACDTAMLATLCQAEVKKRGFDLKVAYVEGDEVTDVVNDLIKDGEEFLSLMDGKPLKEWGYTPIFAQYVPSFSPYQCLLIAIGVILEELESPKPFGTVPILLFAAVLRMLLQLLEHRCGGTDGKEMTSIRLLVL